MSLARRRDLFIGRDLAPLIFNSPRSSSKWQRWWNFLSFAHCAQ